MAVNQRCAGNYTIEVENYSFKKVFLGHREGVLNLI
jgi:hypothetical protein